MTRYDRIASALIGSPLGPPARGLRHLVRRARMVRYPELREILLEEGRIARVMETAITDGMNCVDVGGHLGAILQRMLDLSPTGRHVVVEPMPDKAAMLRRKYPMVEVHQAVLGAAEGTVTFHCHPNDTAYSGIHNVRPSTPTVTLEVACKRLDDLLPPDRPIGFIKAVVAGAEHFVFQGARRTINTYRPLIVFECQAMALKGFDLTAREVHAQLTDEFGYEIYLLKSWLAGASPLSVSELEAAMVYPFQAFKFVAAPARVPVGITAPQTDREEQARRSGMAP